MRVKAEEYDRAWYCRNSNERLMAGVKKILKIFDTEGEWRATKIIVKNKPYGERNLSYYP